MSVRRLADDAFQPAEFSFSNDNARWAAAKIKQYPAGRQQSAVIPLLMRAQDQDGWITRAAIEKIAEMLDMPYIRVLEVATFYTQFQLKPVGTRAHIQVCGTTPCMLRGAEELRAVCQSKIHVEPHHTNEEGTLSWEEVECMGACVNAPMVAIFHDTYEDLTPARLEEIIDAFAEGRGDTIQPGPQNGRRFSSPITGQTTLNEPVGRTREKFVPPVPADVTIVPPPPAAAAPEPTTKGRRRDVAEESAPVLKEPNPAAKVSEDKAEGERLAADKAAGANGEPARAMRPEATGAESKASKVDGGRAPGKVKRTGPGAGAAPTGTSEEGEALASTTGKADVDAGQLGAQPARVAKDAGQPVRKSRAKSVASKPTRELGGNTPGPEDVARVNDDDGKSE